MGLLQWYIAKRYLTGIRADHLARYPQMAVFAQDYIGIRIALDGQFERDELEMLSREVFARLNPEAACLDIGANIGNHALHFSRHFNKVLAFEPNPRTFALLSLNAGLVPNIQAFNLGLSNVAGRVNAVMSRFNMGSASVVSDGAGPAGMTETVPFDLVRLDDVAEVGALAAIAFVKIDVEGHELQCLDGARATLARHKPVIAMEVLRPTIANGSSPSLDLVKSLGYSHFYEITPKGAIGQLPRPLGRVLQIMAGVLTNRRQPKNYGLAPVGRLGARNYKLLICACQSLI